MVFFIGTDFIPYTIACLVPKSCYPHRAFTRWQLNFKQVKDRSAKVLEYRLMADLARKARYGYFLF
jgi:hypothetical protein